MKSFLSLFFCLAAVAPVLAAESGMTRQAVIEYNRENYEEALDLLQKVQAKGECSSQCAYYMGLSQKETGDYAAAAESLKNALQVTEPQKDAVVELVTVLVALDRTDESLEWIRWGEQKGVKPKELAYQKGLILAKQKKFGQAREAFAAAKGVSPEMDQQVEFQSAIALAQQGKTAEASKDLKAIATRYPGTDIGTFAQEYEQRISTAAAGKKWSLFAGLNYLYDDNVTLKSTVVGVAGDSRNEKNSAVSETLRLEYDTALSEKWSANLQYAIQNSNYFRFHDFNTLAHGLTLNALYRNESLVTSLPVNLTHTTLDYRSYSLQTSFRPLETFVFSPQHLGQVSVGYTRRETFNSNVSPENNLDANIYNGQAAYIFLFGEGLSGMVNLRSEMFYEDTKGFEWRNLGTRVGTDALIPVVDGTKLILSAEGTWQDYRESSLQRKDTIFIGSATINQHIAANLFLNLQYAFTRAMSNVDVYDYRRNLLTAGVELRF